MHIQQRITWPVAIRQEQNTLYIPYFKPTLQDLLFVQPINAEPSYMINYIAHTIVNIRNFPLNWPCMGDIEELHNCIE